ncbi:MAG: A24 family peptidase [Thermoleophilia bacterium]
MTDFAPYMAAVAALAGLVIGSFLNVVIYRLPRKESLVRPGSHCPQCGRPVRWYDNVPVLSWLALRGRCRDCGERIAWRYPAVEALTGGSFLLAEVVYGPHPRAVLVMAFLAVLVTITFIDIDHQIIPDRIVLPAAGVGLVAASALEPGRWWVYVVSSLGAGGFLLAIGLLWAGGMGFGDVKMALMMGAVLGSAVIVAMFVSFLVGGLTGVALVLAGRKGRRDKVPFGPFLAVGSAVAALWGPAILDAYLRLL